jgi:hypothetical protein
MNARYQCCWNIDFSVEKSESFFTDCQQATESADVVRAKFLNDFCGDNFLVICVHVTKKPHEGSWWRNSALRENSLARRDDEVFRDVNVRPFVGNVDRLQYPLKVAQPGDGIKAGIIPSYG